MRTSVIICTLGRPELLKATLASISRCDPLPDELIVIDGDPKGSARDAIDAAGPLEVEHIVSEPGLTRQRNRGLEATTGDVVVFFDDDVEVAPDIFGVLSVAYSDEAVAGATGTVIEEGTRRFGNKESRIRKLLPGGGRDGTFTRYGYPRRLTAPEIARDVEFMPGCFMSARLEQARATRFDEKLAGYALGEDEDFSFRLSRLGRILHIPAAVVHHLNMGFTTRDQRAFGRAVMTNRRYLFRKNFDTTPLARLQFFLLFALLLGHRIVNFEWSGAIGLVEGAVGSAKTSS